MQAGVFQLVLRMHAHTHRYDLQHEHWQFAKWVHIGALCT